MNWLLTGKGDMFAKNSNSNTPDAVEIIYYENPTLIETIKTLLLQAFGWIEN